MCINLLNLLASKVLGGFFILIRADGSVSELALPTEDEYTIKDGKLYIYCVEGLLEIKLRK